MKKYLLVLSGVAMSCLNSNSGINTQIQVEKKKIRTNSLYEKDSWEYFLQNLPTTQGDVVDYRGKPVDDADKAAAIVNYDIGNRDLQQCADAIIRLRAEFLYKHNRANEIEFHFTDGKLYRYSDYLNGKRPVLQAGKLIMRETLTTKSSTHQNLRNYLDIVYAYAGTISLEKELKPSNKLGIGVIIIKGGSPGHCFIIVDEKENIRGEKLFKLVEGYSPAQSIYVLKNPENGTEWHSLVKGAPIRTASYYFPRYKAGIF